MIYRYGKRLFDIAASLLMILVLALPMAILALLVRLRVGKPVLFRQERSGMGERPFILYKFRTMTNARGEDGTLLPDGKRLTRLGAFLRSSSLDELPELFCILKGDMSAVGPRPMPTNYLPYFTSRERLRFSVRSGLVPPEVLYRNTTPTWSEQLSWDADYAAHPTFLLDIRILLSVFRCLGARREKNYGAYTRSSLPEERTAEGEEKT